MSWNIFAEILWFKDILSWIIKKNNNKKLVFTYNVVVSKNCNYNDKEWTNLSLNCDYKKLQVLIIIL